MSKKYASGNEAGIVVLSLFLLGSCTAQPDKTPAGASETSATAPSAQSTPKQLPASKPLTSKLQLSYLLDDKVQYALDSVQKSKSLGKMSKGRTAGNDAVFCIVSFHAKNNADEAQTIDVERFQIQAADGQSYTTSKEGATAVVLNGGSKDLFVSKLEPGTDKAFLAIFEVPTKTVEHGADLIVPSTKAGSTDRWVARLPR